MLKPNKIMLIDSTSFNGNKQNPEWYAGYNIKTINGFASAEEVSDFLKDLDVVLSCEIFYNNVFVNIAKAFGVKTVLQYNYEFLDYLNQPTWTLPDALLSPSSWYFEDVVRKFGDKTKVVLLPPPSATEAFRKARETNLKQKHGRILHIAGKAAIKDRNGTETVIEMMKHLKSDVVLDIRTQVEIDLPITDKRINIITDNTENHSDMYVGYDAMILPRRYAGLCLPMNEALISALPVFMTNISPNNDLLPPEWLVESTKISRLMTRTMLNVYEGDAKRLASLVDNYLESDTLQEKQKAFDIGNKNFSYEALLDRYNKVFKELR
jgi:glycosyltransferase involved in cell wall biosynthesis